jgi:hypothetical protein
MGNKYLNMNRKLVISQDAGVTWLDVKGMVNPTMPNQEQEVYSSKPTDSGGYTEQEAVWETNGPVNFNLERDFADATHILIFNGIKLRKKWLFNIHNDDTGILAAAGTGQFTTATEGGTDGGVVVYTMVLTPNGAVDFEAAPQAPTP